MTDDLQSIVTSCARTCEAYPSQWEGTLHDGREFYIRYRNGTLRVYIYRDNLDVAFKSEPALFLVLNDPLHGFLSDAAMRHHTSDMLDWRALFCG